MEDQEKYETNLMAVRKTGVVDPVDDGKDAHEAVATQRQGVGQEDAKVSLDGRLVHQCPVAGFLVPTEPLDPPGHNQPGDSLSEDFGAPPTPLLSPVLAKYNPRLLHSSWQADCQQWLLHHQLCPCLSLLGCQDTLALAFQPDKNGSTSATPDMPTPAFPAAPATPTFLTPTSATWPASRDQGSTSSYAGASGVSDKMSSSRPPSHIWGKLRTKPKSLSPAAGLQLVSTLSTLSTCGAHFNSHPTTWKDEIPPSCSLSYLSNQQTSRIKVWKELSSQHTREVKFWQVREFSS